MGNDRSHEIAAGGGSYRSIFDHIASLENLFAAWREFKKGKTGKSDVIEFSLNLEDNIFKLREELLSGSWICGGYIKFFVTDPKLRTIHKAPVKDRVLYQAIYQVLYPIFDRDFIFFSYSSRRGKGMHAGIKYLQKSLRKLSRNYTVPAYALKCDIKKYFDSIDHKILLKLLRERIDCERTMNLFDQIIDSFHKTPGKGLPLGNVTSQIFANVYLNLFDWFIKRNLKIKYYLRYNDDFIMLSNERNFPIEAIKFFLEDNLKLSLHPNKVLIRKLHQGIDFLGAVLLPHHIVPRTKTKRRILRKSERLFEKLKAGKITKEKFRQSISSYLGHLSHTQSKVICFKLFRMLNYSNL